MLEPKAISMNGPVFAPGQPIVCVLPDGNEEVKICKGHIYHADQFFLLGTLRLYSLLEFPACSKHMWVFEEKHFAPVELAPDDAIAALLEESLCQPA